MEILKIEDLTFCYPQTDTPALDGIDLHIDEGDFTVIAGATGSGKSTLLRLLKRELAPLGKKSGRILYKGTPTDELSPKDAAFRIGFVMQKPEQQLVTDKVWHELAFGLENMNAPQDVIARRVAEMASYFGIEEMYDRPVDELSGGQKQLLNLAAVMVMDPDVLILDEPTAQLDPITASDFISTLKKLNNDFSLTVIIVEHRLEELIPICDKLVILENGKITDVGKPRDVASRIGSGTQLLYSLPCAARIYHRLSVGGECPLTVKEGRRFIENRAANEIRALPSNTPTTSEKVALEFKNVYFRYEKELDDVLRGLSCSVYENEIFCVLGGNGSGKSTALSLAAGINNPYSGSIRVFGKKLKEYKNGSLYQGCVALLPQDVQTVFVKNTVKEELDEAGAKTEELPFTLTHLLNKHPYDLSGGEQQLVALARILATRPRLLLLDEPTKGLDAYKKIQMADILKKLRDGGMTVITVTHDVELAALCADRISLFFRGEIVSVGAPDIFLSENSFYTTAASRMSKGYFDRAVTDEALEKLCLLNGGRVR